MSLTFTKLFSSITESTVWMEADHIRIMWITMLAMADKRGRVWGSVPGLANRARVTVDQAREAIKRFQEPDEDSRTADHDGRRIETIDGGWRLLNYQKYRDVRDEEDARIQAAERQRRKRLKINDVTEKRDCHAMSRSVTPSHDNAEAEAEADKKKEKTPKSEDVQSKEEFVIPSNLNVPSFLAVWTKWVAFRKAKKACKDWPGLWANQLEQLSSWGLEWAIESLNQSLRNDYQGIFPPKNVTNPPKPIKRRPTFKEVQEAQKAYEESQEASNGL